MNRIKYLCDGADRGGGFAPCSSHNLPRLEDILVDLSTYDHDELVTASLGLLTDMYFFEDELFKKANQVLHYKNEMLICHDNVEI